MLMMISLLMLISVCFHMGYYMQFWMMVYSLCSILMFYIMGDYYCFGGFIGGDLMSSLLIGLMFWICGLMLMASQMLMLNEDSSKEFMFMISFLSFFLYMIFLSLNLFWFYIFFELVLIPTLMMILGWGIQPERLQAGMYMLFYTMGASLPMLVGLIYIYYLLGNMNFYICWYESELGGLWFLILIVAFLVKLPMYMLHLWLPKAHVEAPVAGSMILAGILLKLGGYGLYRFMGLIMNKIYIFSGYFISLSLFGGLIISFICMCQMDLSSLIAYSSVSHMGMLLGGFLTFTGWGLEGGLIMMIANGLSSSGLFCLVNIFYERLHTRSIIMIKGMMLIFPSLALFWFVLAMGNMSSPPSINLLGEILLMVGMVGWSNMVILLVVMLSFLSVGYTIYMYSSVQHGKGWIYYSMNSINGREYLVLFCHLFPMNYLILMGGSMCHWS